MSILSKFRIPYSEDLVYGFIFLSLILVPTLIAPQVTEQAAFFSDPLETVKLVGWSILCGIILIVLSRRRQVQTILPKYFLVFLAALVGWTIVALPFSMDKANSIVGLINRMNSSIWFFVVWTVWVFVLSTINKEKFRILVRVFVLISGAVSVLGIVQSYGFAYYGGLTISVRQLIPSFLGNPNFTAMFLAGFVPLVAWLVLTEQNRIWRMVYLFIGASYVWSLVLFNSRAALLGAVLGLMALAVLSAVYKKWCMLLLVLGSLLVVGVTSYFYLEVTRPEFVSGNYSDQSTAERFYVWDYTTHIIQKYPIFGTGLGNYFIAYRQNDFPQLAGTGWFDDPHNIFLYVTANGGIPMGILFAAVVGIPLWIGLRKSILQRVSFEAGVWMAALGAVLVAASFGPVSIPSWLAMGFFIVGVFRSLPAQPKEISGRITNLGGLGLGLLLILVAVLFTVSEVLSWQSQIKLRDGNKHAALTLMKLAVDFNPTNAPAISNWALYSRLNGDYGQTDQALTYAQKLHPHSAGILQSTFQEYIIIWELSHDDAYRDEAIKVMNNYEQTNKNYFITYRDIATGYMAIGDYDKAYDNVKKDVILANQNYQSWVLFAQVAQLRKDRNGVIFGFREAFRLHPSGPVNRVLKHAETEPDINKIILPYNLPTFDN